MGRGSSLGSLTTEVISVTEGEITKKYQYFKAPVTIYSSGSYNFGIQVTSGTDAFELFVDDFEVYEQLDNNLRVVKFNGPARAIVGQEIKLNVNVQNVGLNSASNYSVNLLDDANNVLATVSDCPTLENLQDTSIAIYYTPETVGELNLKAEVVFANDEYLEDNISDLITVDVIEDTGEFEIQIGEGEQTHHKVPADFFNYESTSQVILSQEQIGVNSGIITSLSYFYTFPMSVLDKDMEIWMANVEKSEYESVSDWIDPSEFTLVYDGKQSFPVDGDVATFDIPIGTFYYTGGNLAIMVNKSAHNHYDNCRFYISHDPNGRNCAMAYWDENLPFDGSQLGDVYNFFPNVKIAFLTKTGSVNVTIKDSETNSPLNNAQVAIDGGLSFNTDSNGQFTFDHVPLGDHVINVSKHGYYDAEENVEITEDGQLIEKTISIDPIPLVTVTGKVVPSDNTNGAVAGAIVKLEGYEDYETTTNESGVYTIENVFTAEQEYDVVAEKEGYKRYRGTVTVTGSDSFEMDDIVLEVIECTPIENLSLIEGSGKVIIKWDDPQAGFRPSASSVEEIVIEKTRSRDIGKGMAKVVLSVPQDIWGDGSGYQLLLDSQHKAYGNVIPFTGPLFSGESMDMSFYTDNFDYFIPEGAEPNVHTDQIVFKGQEEVLIPSGLYDWCITNPAPENMFDDATMFIVGANGNINGRADDFEFESGYEYKFTIEVCSPDGYTLADGAFLDIEDFFGYAYNVYRNGDLIGTTSKLSFDDKRAASGGEFTYCVEKAFFDVCESEQVCDDITVTGIKDNDNINIYPNPANNIVNISGVNVEKVLIYNNIGQLVSEQTGSQINVSGYVPGVYVFNIITTNGETYKSKVVVK